MMELAGPLRHVLMAMMVTYLLNGCVTHYSTEPQESEGFTNDRVSEKAKYSLKILKKRMSACFTQYAIATKKNDDLDVEFKAVNHHVSYRSSAPDLSIYMQMCAGESYLGEDSDNGIITISSRGV
ncbi:hypothetical protein V2E67_001895 [Citrobacter freundii]|nr:hypothetical protein [Citrobacter freundii]